MWIAKGVHLPVLWHYSSSGRPLPTGEYKHVKWNEGIRIALDENATIASRAGESWHAISSRVFCTRLKDVGKGQGLGGTSETSCILKWPPFQYMLRKCSFIYKTSSTWPARCLWSCYSFWHTCLARRLQCMGGKAGSQQYLWETNTEILWAGLKNETGVGWRRILSSVAPTTCVSWAHVSEEY